MAADQQIVTQRPCTYNLRLQQQVGAGRCRCMIRSILHQEGREVAKQFIFLFLLAAAITVCWAAGTESVIHVHQYV
jgi:hypothetical protein